MDPLSITASVITVAALSANICKVFKNLRELCVVLPGRLEALNNEIVDFEAVCRQVVATFDERASAQLDAEYDSSIRNSIKKAKQYLLELQVHAFKKEQSRLERIQSNIKTIKCSLNILLGASHTQDITRIRLELQSISMLTSRSAQEQTDGYEEFRNNLITHGDSVSQSVSSIYERVDERISKLEDMLREQSDRLRTQQDNLLSPYYRQITYVHRRRSSSSSSKSSTTLNNDARMDAVGIRVTHLASNCRKGCPCACHTQRKSHTPALFERVMGRLFVGYSAMPLVSPKCDSSECERAQAAHVSMEYWFPMVFLSQIIRLQLDFGRTGPQFALTCLRRVPDTAQCVGFAQAGNMEGLKDLFTRGLASPRDVSSTRGYSLLRWALYANQWETCKFLVHAGADADYRPIASNDNSPRNKACDFVLQGFLGKKAENSLVCLTSGTDWIEEQNFTVLHRIVTGLSFADLEQTLLLYPDDIDALDMMGRTPLIWAAARGDSRAVGLLLAHHANPNILDIQCSGAVAYAAGRGYLLCVRLLLEARANPDPILPKGIRAGSALNIAARNCSDPLVLKTLLDFRADTEATGADGITALIQVARTDNVNFAILLLEYGANINAATVNGQTPLTTAITMNSHNVLRLLLDRWSEYSICPRLQGPHLIRTAALFADLETIKILTSTDHLKLKYDKTYILADCLEQFAERFDATEESVEAFKDLLSVLSEDPNARKDLDNLMESGLLDQKLHRAYNLAHLTEDTGSEYESDDLFEDALEKMSSSGSSEHNLIDFS